MVTYIQLIDLTQNTVYPFLLVVIYLIYISGDGIIKSSDRLPHIRKTNFSYSSTIIVWMNALGVSIIYTSLPSSVSIFKVKSTDPSSVVGDAASSLSMMQSSLLPLSNIIPLAVFSLFYFRNRWDPRTSQYFFVLEVSGYIGLNVLWRCSCFSSFDHTQTPIVPNIFIRALIDRQVVT